MEHRQQQPAHGQRDEGAGRTPAVFSGLREAEDDGEQAESDADCAGHVQPRPALRPGLLDHDRGGDEHERDHRHVDEERPPPGQQVGQEPAQDGAGGETGRHQRPVEAERPLPQGPPGRT
nr:hypothetical protein GCM10020093_069110 [Planobispora longispora]